MRESQKDMLRSFVDDKRLNLPPGRRLESQQESFDESDFDSCIMELLEKRIGPTRAELQKL